MAQIRVAILWHMHQPFYKDLVTGEYRLPWVRLHALKDYYGMVKLLDEFPQAHQTFNLVPSLISQIQDYVSGMARDPFLEVAAKPAADLTPEERRFALAYLFQANPGRMIGRYPRYQALFDLYGASGYNPVRAEATFERKDFADLQVLSQLAWFDEFFLAEPDIAELVRKGRNYTPDDQRFLLRRQHDMLSKVLPAYADAAKRGLIEISTSPFYHPILPLVCDSNQGGVSSPGLPLPARNFRHPEDARAQIQRGLDLHQEVFGVTPKGMWPSEGSVSEEVIALAYDLGVKWMATDEGVLGRTIGMHFERGGDGRLPGEKAAKLYTPHRYEKSNVNMDMIFRDHTLSDLIGFVYSGMPAHDAAGHFIRSIKDSARPVIESGHDALVPIILDGENAWEFYPESGREFLRRVYDALQNDSELEAVTVSEGLEHIPDPPRLRSIVPGSWINANFNIWIGAPEDNRAWDYLSDARDFYEQNSGKASPGPRELAFEELLIAEGSDWNWWYGPEHHSANDRDFDELYRKHLSNVYQALGSHGPEYLAQPIAQGVGKPTYSPQSGYIHPKIGAPVPRYFDWIGAAMYTADRHSGAMHGKVYLLDAMHVGVDEKNLYGRLDFIDSEIPQEQFQIVSGFEVLRPAPGGNQSENVSRCKLVADVKLKLQTWELRDALTDTAIATSYSPSDIKVTLARSFEFQIPLQIIGAELGSTIRLRFSVLRDTLPLDSLPLEGSIALHVVSEEEMEGAVYNYSTSS